MQVLYHFPGVSKGCSASTACTSMGKTICYFSWLNWVCLEISTLLRKLLNFPGLSQKLSVFTEQTEKCELRPWWQKYAKSGCGDSLAFICCFAFIFRQNKFKSDVRSEQVRASRVMASNKASMLSEPKFGLRDTIVKSQLAQMQDSYTDIQSYR